MIEVEGLGRTLAGRQVLSDVTFSAPAGEIVGFLGANGAGKTTTLRVLAGALAPSSGRASVAGYDVATRSREARRRVGWLPEHPPVAGDPTVREYLAFAGSARGLRGAGLSRAIASGLGEVGLDGFGRRRMRALSKGERIRAGLATARIGDPEVLLLDEPTSGLDPGQLAAVRTLIRGERGRRTVLLSTHLLSEVSSVCDRVVILHRGRIAAAGTPEDLSGGAGRIRVVARGDGESMRRALTEVAGVTGVEAISRADGALEIAVRCDDEPDRRSAVAAAVLASGAELLELARPSATLEEVFVRMVATGEGEA